ncbi:MAG: hypothetical protein ACI9WR_001587 [Paracoccaceae bacterium]|jgi:hypothetical protein
MPPTPLFPFIPLLPSLTFFGRAARGRRHGIFTARFGKLTGNEEIAEIEAASFMKKLTGLR